MILCIEEKNEMTIRILIADDHNMIREALGNLIANQPDMTIIAEAEDGLSAVRLAAELSPDIILMDVMMPRLNGIEATRRILAASTVPKVIALSMHLDRRMVLNMLDAGVSGYLLKDCAFDELIHAIGTVTTNRTYLSPKIVDTVVKDYKRQRARNELPMQMDLTSLELDILRFLAEGKETKEIAAMLQISITEAEFLRQEIIVKHLAPRLKRSCKEVISSEKGGDGQLSLTDREKEILLRVKDGNSTAEISLKVGISQDGIKFHLKNIFQKFNTNSRSKAVIIAVENKLIDG
jgi:two-component system response regulator NreC